MTGKKSSHINEESEYLLTRRSTTIILGVSIFVLFIIFQIYWILLGSKKESDENVNFIFGGFGAFLIIGFAFSIVYEIPFLTENALQQHAYKYKSS